jgi:hypothetical protein
MLSTSITGGVCAPPRRRATPTAAALIPVHSYRATWVARSATQTRQVCRGGVRINLLSSTARASDGRARRPH